MPIPEIVIAEHGPALDEALGASVAAVLLRHVTLLNLDAGDVLVRYAEASDHLHWLCSGSLRAELPVGEQQLVLGLVQPHEWVGEVNLIDGGAASATITAIAPSTLFRLDRAALQEIEEVHPEVAATLLNVLLRALAERIRKSSAGIVERASDDEWRLAPASEQRAGWLSILGALFSGGPK